MSESIRRCCFDGCKKKLMLSDFPCRCGKIHCVAHRPSEVHECTFDYRMAGRAELLKTLSTSIVGKKVDII